MPYPLLNIHYVTVIAYAIKDMLKRSILQMRIKFTLLKELPAIYTKTGVRMHICLVSFGLPFLYHNVS